MILLVFTRFVGFKKLDITLHSQLILLFMYSFLTYILPYGAQGVIRSHLPIRMQGHLYLGCQSHKRVPSLVELQFPCHS